MIFNDNDIGITKVEAFYIIRKNSRDTYIEVIADDDTKIMFTISDNEFDPKKTKKNQKINLVKRIFWDVTLRTKDTYYLFDLTKDKVFLTRLDDNLFKLEVNITNPDMIYSPLADDATFKNLIINTEFSFIYEDSIKQKNGDIMNNIILTSSGIRKESFKNKFYDIISKEKLKNIKVLYVTTASDGEEDDDKLWMDEEYKTIVDLGINESNIIEYKIGNDINIDDFDIIYMMGGNTFYLLEVIRKTGFDKIIADFINNGKIYIGSSAGSIILGNSIDVALGYDENNVNMTDYTGLKIIDALIVPHSNRKEEFIRNLKSKTKENVITLYDGDGIIIQKKGVNLSV